MTTVAQRKDRNKAMMEAAEISAYNVEQRGTASQGRTAKHHLTAMRNAKPGNEYFFWAHGALQGMEMMLGINRIYTFEHEVNLAKSFATLNPKLDYDTAIKNGYDHVHVFAPTDFDDLMGMMMETDTECWHSVIIRNWTDWTRGMKVAFETLFTYSEDNEYRPLHVYAF